MVKHLNEDTISASPWAVARYLRISREDGNDESNSIINQRAFISDFIDNSDDLHEAAVKEYVDDGVSGGTTSRDGYQRLLQDVNNGLVNCIVTKDLSRIGRHLIEVDDLLMNVLVAHQVRFIAINDGYDSAKHPLSNLELALINLTNQHYIKDLADKSISSKHVKMKKGEYISCFALFGYRKSELVKNKLEIDDEAAEYVRLIFSLANDGKTITEISRILNAQGIPTPSDYKRRNGIVGGWYTVDPGNSFWYHALVTRILIDERYTGKAINNMYRVKVPGQRNVLRRPREEWIVVPGAHDAIVSEDVFRQAQAAIRKSRSKGVPVDHIFHQKVKCPICHRTMTRSCKYNPHFYCKTRLYTDKTSCPVIKVSQEVIENAVLESIQTYAKVLIDQEVLRLEAIQRARYSKAELMGKMKAESMAIQLLEASVTQVFTEFAEGKITQDAFLDKKHIINDTISHKKDIMDDLRRQAEAISEGESAVAEKLKLYRSWGGIEKLDREIVDLLVDRIVVHGEKDIEIVWADI